MDGVAPHNLYIVTILWGEKSPQYNSYSKEYNRCFFDAFRIHIKDILHIVVTHSWCMLLEITGN